MRGAESDRLSAAEIWPGAGGGGNEDRSQAEDWRPVRADLFSRSWGRMPAPARFPNKRGEA